MTVAKRVGLLVGAAVGGAVGGYLAVWIGLTALTLGWNVLSLSVHVESQDFTPEGWLTLTGILSLLGALGGLVWSVRSEARDAGGSLAAVVVGLPVLALVAFFGLVYGSAQVGSVLFGSFAWGLVGGVALLFVGCMVLGFIYGRSQVDQP